MGERVASQQPWLSRITEPYEDGFTIYPSRIVDSFILMEFISVLSSTVLVLTRDKVLDIV